MSNLQIGLPSIAIKKIWECLRARLDNPIQRKPPNKSGRRHVDFKRNVFQGLLECQPILKSFAWVPDGWELSAFFSDKEGKRHEYMIDFMLTTYPPGRSFRCSQLGQWPRAISYEVLLAAESEEARWENNDWDAVGEKILEDFVKLLDAKSRFKVMVYRVPRKGLGIQFPILRDAFQYLLRHHKGNAMEDEWLFVGIPKGGNKWQGCRDALVHVLDRNAREPILCIPEWAPMVEIAK